MDFVLDKKPEPVLIPDDREANLANFASSFHFFLLCVTIYKC